MSDSCFIERLSRYVILSQNEKTALASFEEAAEDLLPGQRLWEENSPNEMLAIVQSGWLMAYTVLAPGERQILRLHFAGDLVGAQGIAFTNNNSTVVAITPTRLCRFPRAALGKLYEAHPRLAALLYTLGMIESVDLADRLRSVGRTSGRARLAHFLLSVLARKRSLSSDAITGFDLPLTQADLADLVGLTKVHVNRLLRQMAAESLIVRSGKHMQIADETALAEIAHFVDRYQTLASDWFPDPR